MAKNPVHDLQERVASALIERPFYLISAQEDVYDALVCERQRRGWTQAKAEDRIGLPSERHLSKIEPARMRDGRERKYLRAPIKMSINDTGWRLMFGYGVCFVMMSIEEARERMEAMEKPKVRLTTGQKRARGVADEQLDLFGTYPSRICKKAPEHTSERRYEDVA